MAELSVVIPVHKAQACLKELYGRLRRSLETITQDFEIWLVDDASPDRSWELIKGLAREDPRVKGVRFARNFGQHTAITAGLDHCDGDWVVVMDCDLEDRPEDIPRLYAKAKEGHSVVLARRVVHKYSFTKRLAARSFYGLFFLLSGVRYDRRIGNFRICSRQVVERCRDMRGELNFFAALTQKMGYPLVWVDVERDPGKRGSSYTLVGAVKLAVKALIAYSGQLKARPAYTVSETT